MTHYQRYRCPGCDYLFDEQFGNEHEGFPPGTRWAQIPVDWACPDCAVREKPDFRPEETASSTKTVAG